MGSCDVVEGWVVVMVGGGVGSCDVVERVDALGCHEH